MQLTLAYHVHHYVRFVQQTFVYKNTTIPASAVTYFFKIKKFICLFYFSLLIMSKDFAVFNEKILVDDVRLISWCPTADLVLLVSPEDTISLYRSSAKVTMIWSLKTITRSRIKIVTWKPDGLFWSNEHKQINNTTFLGKEVVIGYEDGTVYKVDTAYHSPKLVQCWTPTTDELSCAPITSLVWINYQYKKKHMNIVKLNIFVFCIKLIYFD